MNSTSISNQVNLKPPVVSSGTKSRISGPIFKKMTTLKEGSHPIKNLTDTPLIKALRKGETERAICLINEGADVNARGKHEETPLLRAVIEGNKKAVEALILKGAKVNAKCVVSFPLSIAVSLYHTEIIKLLIENNADVNIVGWFGETPLHTAARKGYIQGVRLLLEAGADPYALDYLLKSPIQLAAERGHKEVLKCLVPDELLLYLDRREYEKLEKDLHGEQLPKIRANL